MWPHRFHVFCSPIVVSYPATYMFTPILGDQLINPPVPCIKEDTDYVADRVIKEEDENLDEASIELVLPDHDTVIHLPNVRSNRNKHGYSVSFEGKQVIIKRRGVGKQLATTMTTSTRKTDSSKFSENHRD